MKRNMMKAGAALVVMLAAAIGCGAAEAGLDLGVFSHYVWRGQVLNDEPVLQPSLTVSGPWGLSFNTWANMDLTDNFDNAGEFTEVDLTVSYALPLEGPVGVEVGIVQFLFPKEGVPVSVSPAMPEDHPAVDIQDIDTGEIYAKVSVDTVLAPTLSANYDYDEVECFYLNAGISHSLEVAEKTTLDLGASIGFGGEDYNGYYFGSADAALNDATVSAGVTYAFSETLSLAASVAYAALLDSDVKDGAEAIFGEKDAVYGGVTLSSSF